MFYKVRTIMGVVVCFALMKVDVNAMNNNLTKDLSRWTSYTASSSPNGVTLKVDMNWVSCIPSSKKQDSSSHSTQIINNASDNTITRKRQPTSYLSEWTSCTFSLTSENKVKLNSEKKLVSCYSIDSNDSSNTKVSINESQEAFSSSRSSPISLDDQKNYIGASINQILDNANISTNKIYQQKMGLINNFDELLKLFVSRGSQENIILTHLHLPGALKIADMLCRATDISDYNEKIKKIRAVTTFERGNNFFHQTSPGITQEEINSTEAYKTIVAALKIVNLATQSIDNKNDEGDTPLHRKIKEGSFLGAQQLVEAGANPFFTTQAGCDAIALAIMSIDQNSFLDLDFIKHFRSFIEAIRKQYPNNALSFLRKYENFINVGPHYNSIRSILSGNVSYSSSDALPVLGKRKRLDYELPDQPITYSDSAKRVLLELKEGRDKALSNLPHGILSPEESYYCYSEDPSVFSVDHLKNFLNLK